MAWRATRLVASTSPATQVSANFPVTAGAYDTTFNPGGFALDGFVAKYDVTLSGAASQIYSTFLGGSDRESLFDIAVDTLGRAHVVGQSRATDFPLVQPVDTTAPLLQFFEAIVSIFDPAGSTPRVLVVPVAGVQRSRHSTAVAVNRAGETFVVGLDQCAGRHSRRHCPMASR